MLLLFLVLFPSAALCGLVAVMFRVFRNVGPLDLEDYARRNHVIYLPVSQDLVKELADWSKPVHLKIETHQHPLLGEIVVKSYTPEEAAGV